MIIHDADNGESLVITQQDIRELQMAKAAIRTGIDILLQQAGMSFDELEAIYLAGAFGNVLQKTSCIDIGLIPPLSMDNLDKIINIGNAAAEGALKALLSDTALAEARVWQTRINYIELANQETFQDLFINNINFK